MEATGTPVAPRLPLVDALRGFALFGVFGINLWAFSGLELMSGGGRETFSSRADAAARFLGAFLIEMKFMGLFSFLFGMSFCLFLARVSGRGAPAIVLFYRRVGWLFVIGAVHGFVLWWGDILRFYALWALLLPLFLRFSSGALLRAAFLLAVVAPALVAGIHHGLPSEGVSDAKVYGQTLAAFARGSFAEALAANWRQDWSLTFSLTQLGYQLSILGRMLLGVWVARTLDLDASRSEALLVRVVEVGLAIGLPMNLVFALHGWTWATGFPAAFLHRLLLEGGFLGATLAYAAGLSLLFIRPGPRALVLRLAPLGQMALSAYIGQTLLGIWLFYGYAPGPHLMGKVGPGWLALLWLVGYPVQVELARIWMCRFRLGPMEWLWRTLTWGEIQRVTRARPAG